MNQLKPIIQQLSNARQGLNEQRNVSENIEKLKQSFDQLGPAMRQQMDYIQNMNPTIAHEKEGSEKLLEQKRYFVRFLDIMSHDLGDLINIAKNVLCVKDRSLKTESIWERILYSKDKYIGGLKDGLTQDQNYIELVFKMLNYRDNLITQIIKSVLHRKLILWKDMGISNEPFVHAQLKNLLSTIEQKMTRSQILSEKLEFKDYQWQQDISGVWKYQQDSEDQIPISTFLNLMNESLEDVFQSLRNYSNLSADPIVLKQIQCNSKQVKSLRSQIEYLSEENLKLQQSLNEIKLQKKSNEYEEIKRLQGVIEDLEINLSRKEREINELMANSKGSLSIIQNLRDKLKETEEENHRFSNVFFPKQRELEAQQLKLLDEFQKIKKDVDTYSSLFKMESQIRERALKSKDQSDEQVQKLVDMLGKQKQKTKELQEVIKQKESIINKILEARRESLVGIEVATQEVNVYKQNIASEQQRCIELQSQIEGIDKKYKDMFEINTHFNKRIYELERQKKQLLDLLKQHDIEPDPTKLNFHDD
ncbi:hypothetical protein pb186bvf_016698 [Paramecium bursaria]